MVASSVVLSDASEVKNLFRQYDSILTDATSSDVWSGASRDSLVSKAEEFIETYENPIVKQLEDLVSALNSLVEYKKCKAEVKDFESRLDSASDAEKSFYVDRINEGNSRMQNLKAKIEDLLNGICSVVLNDSAASMSTAVSDGVSTMSSDTLVETALNSAGASTSMTSEQINELLGKMKSLTKLSDSDNLANYYEAGYIEKVMDGIKNGSGSSRQKAIDSALTLIKLAADQDVKLDYDWGGAHGNTSTKGVLNGADCSSFVSYCLNQGTNANFDESTSTFATKFSKNAISFDSAKPGDIINKSSGHVELIIENHPEEGYFITAEARKPSVGITLTKLSYADAKKWYGFTNAYDMSSVYGD